MTERRPTGRAWERLRSQVLDRDGWQCTKCGARGVLEVHHVVPLAAGGDSDRRNLEAVCVTCHLTVHRAKRPRRMRHDPKRIEWRRYLHRLAREDDPQGDTDDRRDP